MVNDVVVTVSLGVDKKLDSIINLLNVLVERNKIMGVELDRLIATVTDEDNIILAIESTVNGLVQQIKDLAASGGSPAAFTALANQIDAQKARLAAAVVAGTEVGPK
jgi:division protein CdvB (Snf7/Vps24/ESCRT-III family)